MKQTVFSYSATKRRPRFFAGTLLLFGKIFAIGLLASTGFFSADPDWKTSVVKEGITIETRPVSGSAYKEFRARMVLKSTLEKANQVMQDIPGYTRWMKDCKEARRIAQLSPTSGIIYSLQSAPWPIAPREAVVKYTYRKSATPASFEIFLEAAPDALPLNSGHVRIARLNGYWKFSQISAQSIEVVYGLHSEPGGYLPDWAVSAMVAHLPFETLNKLRSRLEN